MDAELSKKLRVLKSFLILLIVLIHSATSTGNFGASPGDSIAHYCNTYIQSFVVDGISAIAVPLFFLVSGYLFFLNFKPEKSFFIEKINKRTRTILIPYLLYSLICLSFFYAAQKIHITAPIFRAEQLCLSAYLHIQLQILL